MFLLGVALVVRAPHWLWPVVPREDDGRVRVPHPPPCFLNEAGGAEKGCSVAEHPGVVFAGDDGSVVLLERTVGMGALGSPPG